MADNTTNYSSESPCPPLETYFLRVPRIYYEDNLVISFIVINAILAFISSFNNFIVIYTIARTGSLQIPSNILILGLAVSDFGVGFVAQPSYSIFKYFELKRIMSNYCLLGMIYNYSIWTLAAISLLTLTAIAGDRFLAVHLHLRYQELITTKRYVMILACIWVTSVAICICRMLVTISTAINILSTLSFVCVIATNLFFLVRISRVIHRHSVQIQAQQQSVQQSINMPRYKKSVNTMYYVIGAFVLCYVPFVGTLVVHANVGKQRTQYMLLLTMVTETLVMFNGVLNPVIYCWRIEDIRSAASQLLRKICRRNHGNQAP